MAIHQQILEWQAAHPNITWIGWGIVWAIMPATVFRHCELWGIEAVTCVQRRNIVAQQKGLRERGPATPRLLDALHQPVFVIEPFSLTRAGILVVVTATLGYAVGYLFALSWNRLSVEEAL